MDVDDSFNIDEALADVSLDISAFSDKSNFVASTPKTKKRPQFKCDKCDFVARSEGGLKHHKSLHKLKDLYARAPNCDSIVESRREVARKVFESIVASQMGLGEWGPRSKAYVGKMSEEVSVDSEAWQKLSHFTTLLAAGCLDSTKAVMPSASRQDAYQRFYAVVSKESIIDSLMILAKVATDDSDEVLKLFVQDILFATFDEVFKMFLEGMLPPEKTKQSSLNVTEKDLDECVHYVGGYVLRVYIKLCGRYPESWRWQERLLAMKGMLCEDGDGATGALREVSKWTRERSRGGLRIINDRCWQFFRRLHDVLARTDRSSYGSLKLHHDCIVKEALQDRTMCVLWDVMTTAFMSENNALDLLQMFIRTFVNVEGPAIARRRVRQRRGFRTGKGKMALRAYLKPHHKSL